jgi:hypothetical protein
MSTELKEATTGDLRLPRFEKLSFANLLIKSQLNYMRPKGSIYVHADQLAFLGVGE